MRSDHCLNGLQRSSATGRARRISSLVIWLIANQPEDWAEKGFRLTAISGIIFVFSVAAQLDSACGSTLYLAYLRPESPAVTQARAQRHCDYPTIRHQRFVSFQCSNLTSAVTGVHIHGPADPGETRPDSFRSRYRHSATRRYIRMGLHAN